MLLDETSVAGHRQMRYFTIYGVVTVISSSFTDIHESDYIYRFLLDNFGLETSKVPELYLETGKSSGEMLRDILKDNLQFDLQTEFDLLEFASGYGCVTRHLGVILPQANVTACDIHQQAVDFISSKIGVSAVISNSKPEAFELNSLFDIVFALSFFSHMPAQTFGPWLKALFRHVRPGGHLIFTTHGQVTNRLLWKDGINFDSHGFHFIPVSEQGDIDTSEYGTATCTSKFVKTQARKYLSIVELQFIEGLWWGHQDLYIVQKPLNQGILSGLLVWFRKNIRLVKLFFYPAPMAIAPTAHKGNYQEKALLVTG